MPVMDASKLSARVIVNDLAGRGYHWPPGGCGNSIDDDNKV